MPKPLLIVEDTGGRGDLWRVYFDDALGTRLHFDDTGGDDFNNGLLRVASVVSWELVGAGAVLAVLAARRAWRGRCRNP